MSTQTSPEETEIDGDLAAKMAVVEQQWPHTVDAEVWAEKWMEHMETSPTIAHDKGTMLGWFANAIMAGYDTAQMRAANQADGKTYAVMFTPPGTDEAGTPEGIELLKAILEIDVKEDGYSYAAFGPKTRENIQRLIRDLERQSFGLRPYWMVSGRHG